MAMTTKSSISVNARHIACHKLLHIVLLLAKETEKIPMQL